MIMSMKSEMPHMRGHHYQHKTSHTNLILMTVVLVIFIAILNMYVPLKGNLSESLRLPWRKEKVKVRETTSGNLRDIKGPAHNETESEITIEDSVVEGVKVRLYKSDNHQEDTGGKPGLVFYHGGGWVDYTSKDYDSVVLEMMKSIDLIIMSVDYRKSQEAPFPAPFNDCVIATKYFLKNADVYGVNPEKIAILGDSAGGNLAAAVAIKLRDDKFLPLPKVQVLIYPCLQAHDFSLPSYTQNGHDSGLTMAYYWSMYATGTPNYTNVFFNNNHTTTEVKQATYNSHINHETLPKEFLYKPYSKPNMDHGNVSIWEGLQGTLTNPYFAPLLTEDLNSVIPAFVYTAQYDVLRDEGILYATRLKESGVTVSHVHGSQAYHGVWNKFETLKLGRQCMDSVIRYLQDTIVSSTVSAA